MDYIRRHWRGELSLPLSFWVNLFGIGVVLQLFDTWLISKTFSPDPVVNAQFGIAYSVLVISIIYPWQIVGTWRSANRRRSEIRSGKASAVVQVLIALGLISTIITIMAFWPSTKETIMIALGNDPFGEYSVAVSDDHSLLLIDGPISFGVSARARSVLKKYPTISNVVLTSSGGRLYEGHELGRLFIEYDLDTYAKDRCYSACVLAFAGGKFRALVSGASLGFHQPSAGISGSDAHFNQKEVEALDRVYYQSRGISPEFLDRMFIADPSDLWYPTIEDLLNANVIHGQVTAASIGIAITGLPWEDVQRSFREIPIYETLEQHAPLQFESLMRAVRAEVEKGTTFAEMRSLGARHMNSIAAPLLSKGQDASMIRFIGEMVRIMQILDKSDPALCVGWLFPEAYGHTSDLSAVPQDQMHAALEAMGQIIIDASAQSAPQVDLEAAEAMSESIFLLHEEDLSFLDPSLLSTRADYSRACTGAISIYSAILGLEESEAANLLRYLFSPGLATDN